MLRWAQPSSAMLPQLLQVCQAWQPVAWFASKAATAKASAQQEVPKRTASAKAAENLVPTKDWKAIKLPEATASTIPTVTAPGQAFVGDLRSTSGLCMGDDIHNHTEKWLQGGLKSPMEYIQSTPPIKVSGAVVASYGSDDPALGCPVEYINLKGTSYDNPAVCKYTGNKYYSDDWMHAGH
eukprot:GHRR01003510.1.p1 GENE.GHRR01003510.1~~GHRR01003510.1.p1  ORF type:complete len:181 (+),score=70.33 GHRR01003510.1:193-735(+)